MSKPKIIIICGPTASGKSKYALKIASSNAGEIINSDSAQIYKEIPILSCCPNEADKDLVPHHLYNHKSLNEEYSVGKFLEETLYKISDITLRGKLPIIVGGTGLYIKALQEGINQVPEIPQNTRDDTRKLFEELGNEQFYEELKKLDSKSAAKLDIGNSQRLIRAYEVFAHTGKSLYDFHEIDTKSPLSEYDVNTYIITKNREDLYKKCNKRFAEIFDNGAKQEVEQIANKFPPEKVRAIGYDEIYKYIKGEISREEVINIASQKTRNYAKRQITFFKHQIDGKEINIEEIDEKPNKLHFPK